jgi:hypothetical protein
VKENDDQALPGEADALLAADTSVKTGRTLEQIAASRRGAVWQSHRVETKQPASRTPRKKPAARSKKTASVKRARKR